MTEKKGRAEVIDVKGLLSGDNAFIRTVLRAALLRHRRTLSFSRRVSP
jgi:hypothetical protein